MSNPYPSGQCTWGAAQLFTCLQDISTYGNFGNGGDWYDHAVAIGLPTSRSPVAGWLASFSTEGWPSGPGDVGLIVSVNNDNTVTRYGTNWHQDGQWSTDRISTSILIGSFKPPCDSSSSGTQVLSQSSTGDCRTFQWSFPLGLGSVCFDSVVGIAAFGGGLLMMTVGMLVMIAAIGFKASQQQESSTPSYQPGIQQPTKQPTPVNTNDIVVQARQRAAQRNLQYRRGLPAPKSAPSQRRSNVKSAT